MSSDLVWLLLKKNNSFVKKLSGIEFSAESGNVASLNSRKYSGLVNKKVRNSDTDFLIPCAMPFSIESPLSLPIALCH